MPLASVLGQSRAVQTLTSALSNNSVHHAYLFAGPEGVGKELTAVGLAQALLCPEKGDGKIDGCGSCGVCQRILHRNHPDVQWVVSEDERVSRGWAGRSDFTHVPSREIKVEQIRLLQERLVLKPLEAPRKIVILVSAQTLNVQAQNAFLKTLEEPPQDTLIVLLASAPDKLLPTIRSRCSRVQFGPLPREVIAEKVKAFRKVDDATAGRVAEMAEGSLSKALEWNVETLGLQKNVIEKFENLSPSNARAWLQFAEEFGESRDVAEETLGILRLWFREVMLANLPGTHLMDKELLPLAQKSKSLHSEEVLHRRRALIEHASIAISSRNGAPRLQLERMLVEMLG